MKSSQKTIVIADDDDDLRLLIQVTLENSSYRILSVQDGCRALEVVQSTTPDLLILDWMMPGLTGEEVACHVRSHPQTREIPIVMLTAKDGAESRARMEGFNLSGYLVKPFSPLELIRLVQKVLQP